MSKSRPIEMCRIKENGIWDTVFVDIPAITHLTQIEEVARIKAAEQHGPGVYALYNSMDDEMPEMDDVWVITFTGNAVGQERFVVEGAKSEEEALEMMGEEKRSTFGPSEVVAWACSNNDDYEVKPWR